MQLEEKPRVTLPSENHEDHELELCILFEPHYFGEQNVRKFEEFEVLLSVRGVHTRTYGAYTWTRTDSCLGCMLPGGDIDQVGTMCFQVGRFKDKGQEVRGVPAGVDRRKFDNRFSFFLSSFLLSCRHRYLAIGCEARKMIWRQSVVVVVLFQGYYSPLRLEAFLCLVVHFNIDTSI